MTLGRSKAAKSRKVEISFHLDNAAGSNAHAAINVKIRNLPLIEASEDARQFAWDETVREFWESASLIAQAHGYSGVFPEGRSGGWLVPYTQHNAAGKLITTWTGQGPDKGYPRYPDMEDRKERRRFVEFRAAIEGLIEDCKDRYHDLAMDAGDES